MIKTEQHKTDYLAPVSLGVVVRDHPGNAIEAAVTGCGSHDHASEHDCGSGPVLFASRIPAEVYAYFRSKHETNDGTSDWHVIPLLDYDLRELIRVKGGSVRCMIAFGMTMSKDGALLGKDGTPTVLYTVRAFAIEEEEVGKVVFSFEKPFEPILEEWAAMGLHSFEDTLRELDAYSASASADVFKQAIAQSRVEDTDLESIAWGVYCPVRARWFVTTGLKVFASERTLH